MAAIDVGIIVTAVNNATAGIREIKGEVEGLGASAQETANRLKAIQVVIAGIVISKVTELTKSFVEGSAKVEVLRTRLALLNGDWQKSGTILDEIISKYDKAGTSGDALANVFVQLRGIGQNEGQALALIDAIGKLSAATNRTPEDIKSIGDAITKMVAKGTVDMRVLITVLASQFPEAVRAAATAAGSQSVTAFTELAKAGQISAQQFVEYFKTGIQNKFGDIFSLTSGQLNTALNRFSNLWTDAIRKLNLNTPVAQELTDRLDKMSDSFEHLISQITVQQVQKFFEVLDNIGKTLSGIATVLGPVVGLFAAMGATVAQLLAGLPPEVVTGGIVGYLVYGRLGAAAVAIVLAVFDRLGIQIKGGFINDIITYMNSNEALALGVAGYVMFGPLGAAALGIIGAKLASLRNEAKQLASGVGGGGVDRNGNPFAVAPIPGSGDSASSLVAAAANVQRAMANINAGVNVFDLIKQKAQDAGLSVEQTAAIIAHAKAESNLGGNLVGDNGHSFGLFQFNDKGELAALQKFAQESGKDWLQFGTQVDFVISRFKDLGGASTQTATQASEVMNRFERFNDFLKNGDFGAESLKRIKSANDVLKQIASTQQVPTTTQNEDFSVQQKATFDSLLVTTAQVNKQIDQIDASLNQLPAAQAATKVNDQFSQMSATLDANIQKLQNLSKELGSQGKTDAQAKVNALLETEIAKRNAIGGLQGQELDKQTKLANLMSSQAQIQQQILQMKAQEAEINLKLNYSNNALLNLLGGTSGGQIVVQTEQQRVQLAQQVLSYEQQINALEQQKISTTDPQLRASIDATIQKYNQLSINTKAALANLSAESVAQRQLWQSVGQSLEQGAVGAITALVTHTGTLKDVTLQMYNAITQAAAKYLIQLIEIKAIQPLLGGLGLGGGFSGIFGGLFAANGAVVPSGVKMFANGGIIGGPTLFGMAGEAGTEAIMPLTNVGGKLGVKAVGGGGDQYHIHISAIDTQTGTEFLLKNIQTVQAGLMQRKNINRGGRLGNGMP